jgi:hypothetical protein
MAWRLRAHVQDDADLRRGQRGQVADVAEVPGTHLQHQVPSGMAGLQDGERQPDLGVERSGRGDNRAVLGQDVAEHVLGGGLPRRAGQRDDCRVREAAEDVPGKCAEGGGDVGHHDGRAVHRPGRQDAHGTCRERLGGEVVPVRAGTGQGGEHPSRGDLPRIARGGCGDLR